MSEGDAGVRLEALAPASHPRPSGKENRGHEESTALSEEGHAMSVWIYFFGEVNGEDIKVGRTSALTWGTRLRSVQADQTTNALYVPLAAVRGDPHDETAILRRFKKFIRTDKGSKREYLWPKPEVYEYVAWLRAQWFTAIEGSETPEDVPHRDPAEWAPSFDPEHRRIRPPEHQEGRIVQDWETIPGPLQGTAWGWMPNPRASFQDYFTPAEIIAAVRDGMGGLDLDAASHWAANQTHRIPDYFTAQRSAFENDWHGNVWLNPPYGDNAPWWKRIMQQMDADNIDQLAILSPVWAFTTDIARPLMERASLTILLHPTPKFWGNSEGKTGTNNPHAIVYFGKRVEEMAVALRGFGIPMAFLWDLIGFGRDEEEASPQRLDLAVWERELSEPDGVVDDGDTIDP